MRFNKRSIFIPEIDTLAVSDLHLGRPSNSPKYAHPTLHDASIETKLNQLITGYNPSTIVFNGDTFHHTVPLDESEKTIQRIVLSTNAETVFTIGNHEDTIDSLENSLPQNSIIKHEHSIEDYIFHHGHETPNKTTGTHIIGHLHPSKNIRERQPAHIKAASENLKIIVTPSFNPGINGTKIEKVDPKDICPIFNYL